MILNILEEVLTFDCINNIQFDNTPGMSGKLLMELLNRCARHIDKDKCYLEIGVYAGKTLNAASLGNNNIQFYGIDNFSENFGYASLEERRTCVLNLTNSRCNVHFIECDCWKFLEKNDGIDDKKVEIYFYDGPHSYEDQYNGIIKVFNMLADHALILIDDTNDERVKRATLKAIEDCPKNLKLYREFNTPIGPDGFWNGLIAIEFRR